MNRRRFSVRTGIVGLAVIAAVGATLALAQAELPNPLKGLLERTGLKHTPLSETEWRVPFDAADGTKITVFVVYNDDQRAYALLFTTVVDKPDDFVFDRDVLLECMKINNDQPGMKLCLDYNHGDLDLQTEVLLSTLTADALKLHIDRLAALAEKYGPKLRAMVK